ncbi:hypothetical protein DMH88_18770 [Escherichia coli]|nr:hypothetical protein [Escherichia coli]
MWSGRALSKNNQPVTDDALEIIGEMLRFTWGGRFYGGLEQLKTFCQPQSWQLLHWISSPRGNKLEPPQKTTGHFWR